MRCDLESVLHGAYRAIQHFRYFPLRNTLTDQHSDVIMSLHVWLPAFVDPLLFGLLDALSLSALPVRVILAGYGCEHVQHHSVDGIHHRTHELIVAVGELHVAGRQVEGYDPYSLALDRAA